LPEASKACRELVKCACKNNHTALAGATATRLTYHTHSCANVGGSVHDMFTGYSIDIIFTQCKL